MEVIKKYLFYCSFAGGLFTLALAVMAFFNVEALKIKRNHHIKSGVNLIITSVVRY
jgi:preprotein translocase subunit SecY